MKYHGTECGSQMGPSGYIGKLVVFDLAFTFPGISHYLEYTLLWFSVPHRYAVIAGDLQYSKSGQ